MPDKIQKTNWLFEHTYKKKNGSILRARLGLTYCETDASVTSSTPLNEPAERRKKHTSLFVCPVLQVFLFICFLNFTFIYIYENKIT